MQRSEHVTDLDHFSACVTCCKVQSSRSIVRRCVNVCFVFEENLYDSFCKCRRSEYVTDLDHFSACVTCCNMQSSPFIVVGLFDVRSVLEEDLTVDRFR